MICVTQYNQYACVGACFESVKRDLGEDFSHEKFIKDNLDIFNGGNPIEGSCDIKDIPEVARRMNLECKMPQNTNIDLRKDFVILYVWWKNSSGEKHCVRLAGFSADKFSVMEPVAGKLETIPKEWVKCAFIMNQPQPVGPADREYASR